MAPREILEQGKKRKNKNSTAPRETLEQGSLSNMSLEARPLRRALCCRTSCPARTGDLFAAEGRFRFSDMAPSLGALPRPGQCRCWPRKQTCLLLLLLLLLLFLLLMLLLLSSFLAAETNRWSALMLVMALAPEPTTQMRLPRNC